MGRELIMAQQKLFGEQISKDLALLGKDLAKFSAHLKTHESVCQERWQSVTGRLKRIELVLMSSAGAIILLLSGIIWKG